MIEGSLAIRALYACGTFYCLPHRVRLFIDCKSLEWRFYSSGCVRLSMFSLSCQSAPPPPTLHMPELGDRQTDQLNHVGLNIKKKGYSFIPLIHHRILSDQLCEKGEMSKSPLIILDSDSLFSRFPVSLSFHYFLRTLSVWYRPEPGSLRRHL